MDERQMKYSLEGMTNLQKKVFKIFCEIAKQTATVRHVIGNGPSATYYWIGKVSRNIPVWIVISWGGSFPDRITVQFAEREDSPEMSPMGIETAHRSGEQLPVTLQFDPNRGWSVSSIARCPFGDMRDVAWQLECLRLFVNSLDGRASRLGPFLEHID